MPNKAEISFKDRREWRAWLEKNHADVKEVWLVYFKKHTGKRSISYDDSVEEALCFGWIDTLIRRLDDERYARKFTPRTNTRKWSAANLKRIRQLIESGLMTEHGLAKIPPDIQPQAPVQARPLVVPTFFAEALAGHPTAREYFEQLAPSYRRNYIHWVCSAKREETRLRRLQEAIALLVKRKKLGMK